MTREERKQYCKEYRAEGFGKIADRKHYRQNAERLRAESLKRYRAKKAQKFSQEIAKNLQGTK